MRRIFTLAIAFFAIVISQNVSGQTTCTPVTTTAPGGVTFTTVGAATVIPASSGVVNGTVTYTSGIYYSNTPITTLDFFFTITKDASTGSDPNLSAVITIRRGAGGSTTFTCAPVGTFNATTTSQQFYFSISSTTPVLIPAGTNFDVQVAFTNTVNRSATISQFGIENNALPAGSGAALPVRISSISVTKEAAGAKLVWNVDTEENVANYQIERSSNGNSFAKIGTVTAAGARSYSFTDNAPLTEGYYRVKAVDQDGKFGLSTIVRLKGGKSGIVLRAYPMPAQSNVTIEHSTAASASRITVSSQDGRLVKSIIPSAGVQKTNVDLSTLTAGMYLVRFDAGNGEVENLKIVKQ